jgi:hypothetical protein
MIDIVIDIVEVFALILLKPDSLSIYCVLIIIYYVNVERAVSLKFNRQ